MSDLDKIKTISKKQPKVWLEGVNFDFKKSDGELGPHIHYVTQAASLMDEPLLLKSKEQDKQLTQEETGILKNLKIKKEKNMSNEQVLKDLTTKIDSLVTANEKVETENTELKKQLKTEKIEKEIEDFSFENKDEVVKALMDSEGKDSIIKAFTFLKEQIKEEVEDTELQKQLDAESGTDADGKVVEKSLNERIKEEREAK